MQDKNNKMLAKIRFEYFFSYLLCLSYLRDSKFHLGVMTCLACRCSAAASQKGFWNDSGSGTLRTRELALG